MPYNQRGVFKDGVGFEAIKFILFYFILFYFILFDLLARIEKLPSSPIVSGNCNILLNTMDNLILEGIKSQKVKRALVTLYISDPSLSFIFISRVLFSCSCCICDILLHHSPT